MTLTVPCLLGLESLVADEMKRLQLNNVRAENGRVHCEGTMADIARLNINLRCGARVLMDSDFAVSVTGLAGPGGDEYGNPVGTVYIGFSDGKRVFSRRFHFTGDREAVRRQTVEEALRLILEQLETE